MWSNDASSRVPDLISVLIELHKPKLLGLYNSIRWYITSSFKVLCQVVFEKIDLTVMDLKQNLCPLITWKIFNLQPIMIHHRICLITESVYKEMWSDDASSRMPDLISVLFELHKTNSLGLFNCIRWYITSSFKVLCQIIFEKFDLTIMDFKQNVCSLIT